MAASFSRDPLFEVVLRQLPEQVAAGLRTAGLADPAILESYPCDSYKELVDSGATDGGTWCYSGIGVTSTMDAGGMDIGGLSLSSPFLLSPSFLSSLVSLRHSLLLPPLSASDTHKSRSVIIELSFVSFGGNAVRALETEPERKGFSGGGRGKVRRTTKGRSGIKSRKDAGMPTDGHMVSELRDRELEPVECVPQVGNSSPSGVELVSEFGQTGKAETRLGVSQISEKSELGSDSRISDVCGEDYPAEQLSSSFQSPARASGSINIHAAHSVPAAPVILLLYWTLVKDGVLPGGYEAQFALLETAILKGAKRALKRTAGSDNLTAAVWLHQRSLQDEQKGRS